MTENITLNAQDPGDDGQPADGTDPVFLPPQIGADGTVPQENFAPVATAVNGVPKVEPHEVVRWGDEQVAILDPRPMPSTLQDVGVTRRSVVTAMTGNDRINLTQQAAYVVTYTATPNSWGPLREAAKHNMLQPRRPSAMRISEIEADLLLPSLVVGPQPRTETDPSPVAPPRIRGEVVDGQPIAEYVMEFRDQQHLEDWTREIVKSTDKQGGDYQTSIIEKGVSEPITVVPGRVVLADRGDGQPDSFTALVVIDGITRVVRSWQVHLGWRARINEVADQMVRNTVAPSPRKPSSTKSLHDLVLETRNNAVDAWRATYTNSLIQGVGTAAIDAGRRTAQAFTLRARIVVGCETASTCQLDVADQFPDAAAELVRYTQENKAWRTEASAANAMHGVVRSLKGSGDIDSTDLADFLLGNIRSDDLVPGTQAILGTDLPLTPSAAALYRGVHLLRFFTRPGVFERSKADLRTSLNAGAIWNARYAHILAPLVEAPWRLHKASSLSQARNAYKRRGALTDEAMSPGWRIVVDSPTRLYRLAVGGDRDARITLMTAGGIALLADRFLTTEVVAGSGSGGEYQALWRARSIEEVIALLGHPDNHRGLLQLALAMQEFTLDKEAANGLPTLERERRTATESGRFYVVHGAAENLLQDDEDGIQREHGNEIELTTRLLMSIADYTGTRRDKTDKGRGNGGGTARPLTLQELAEKFTSQMRSVSDTGIALTDRATQDSSRVVVDAATQRDLSKIHRRLSTVIDWIDDNADKEPAPWGENVADDGQDDVYEPDGAAEGAEDEYEADEQ